MNRCLPWYKQPQRLGSGHEFFWELAACGSWGALSSEVGLGFGCCWEQSVALSAEGKLFGFDIYSKV